MEQSHTIRIDITEQQKAVTAAVRYEVSGDSLEANAILEEAKRIFNEAQAFTAIKSMAKVRGQTK